MYITIVFVLLIARGKFVIDLSLILAEEIVLLNMYMFTFMHVCMFIIESPNT